MLEGLAESEYSSAAEALYVANAIIPHVVRLLFGLRLFRLRDYALRYVTCREM